MTIRLEPHPRLDAGAFTTQWPDALAHLASPAWLTELLAEGAEAPIRRTEETRSAVRDLLRHGGYKPTGRGKPSSEYLVRAAGEGQLTSINPAVDTCNVVSLHSGLPISVVDLDRATEPLRIALAGEGVSYVFNASGQEIRVGGLLCLHDADGPCANAVKDAQRTKTSDTTRTTLSIVWGTRDLPDRTDETVAWYIELLERQGTTVQPVVIEPSG